LQRWDFVAGPSDYGLQFADDQPWPFMAADLP
jgi:hypothetical protein